MTNQRTSEQTTWVLPFTSAEASSAENGVWIVGGKGANLARLAQAGFPVPDGFLIATYAYRAFVDANHLGAEIRAALPEEVAGPEDLIVASDHIRGLFAMGRIPADLQEDILSAYKQLMGEETSPSPVAVRSSATAEDLPEMSFAGQQDTYLNILGDEQLLKAVIDCWSSLWTARAIGYRLRNHVPQEQAALAVVVQRMVESEVSGVMFTANPLTGLRTETVIDATFGLGEALVSGRVEPDHYEVDTKQGRVISKTLGAKALSLHGQTGGGTSETTAERRDQQALPDLQIIALARMGQAVAAQYGGFPQDIEWAWANNKLYLLQSRPITSLFPIPEGTSADPLKVTFSFAAIQGMLDPVTPLGRDALCTIFALAGGLFGIKHTSETQTSLLSAGERLWVNLTPCVRNTIGRKIVRVAVGIIEPTIQQTMEALWDDPKLQPERPGISGRARMQIARFALPMLGNVLLNFITPNRRREFIVSNGERVLEDMRAGCDQITGSRWTRLARAVDLFQDTLSQRLPHTFLLFVSGVAAGMASFNFLRMLTEHLPEHAGNGTGMHWPDLILEITRGLPNNPTTQMDLDLWKVAQTLRRDPAVLAELQNYPAPVLAARYQSGEMPTQARQVIARFLDRYGGRGFGEIDMGRPRWWEDPTHVFEVLTGFLQIKEGEQAPDAVFSRGEAAAQAAIDKLVSGLRHARGGWYKAPLARFFASRMRALMGIRESPKFFAVRLMGLLRRELLEAGADFVRNGELDQSDDLFYLTFAELRALAAKENRDWRDIIARRREAINREKLRRQIPRVLLSDGRAFYKGMRSTAGEGKSLTGSPVSPGMVEGPVRIVLDPRQAGLLPGEIMVCPGTDPSWTPLFLTAAGLVMEVGGMMTHGAVVAREYGIPAVVGVDQATIRLKTGQHIRVDGSSGQIELLD